MSETMLPSERGAESLAGAAPTPRAGNVPAPGPYLPAARIARGDPVLRRLLARGTHPVAIGVGAAVLLMLVRMAAAWRAGHLTGASAPIGFLDDPATYAQVAAGAIVFTCWAWLPRGVEAMFDALVENRVLGGDETSRPADGAADDDDAAAGAAPARVREAHGWAAVPPIALAAASLVVTLLMLPGYLVRMAEGDAWSVADPFSLALSVLWAVLGLYALGAALGYYAVAHVWLRRLLRARTPELRPMHPDGAAGFGPIGDLSARVGYLVMSLGLVLAATALAREFYTESLGIEWEPVRDLVIAAIVYVIGVPIVFLGLPAVAHGPMRDARQRMLLEIAEAYEGEYVRLKDGLTGRIASLEDGTRRLERIASLYETTRGFPVWPIRIQILRRFGASFLSPIALTLATRLAQRLVGG